MLTIQEIKDYMKANKIGYATLSEKSGVPIGTLKSIFSFRTPTPRIDTIEAIERALGLTSEATLPKEVLSLIELISTLSDEECEEVSRFIDYVISKRNK